MARTAADEALIRAARALVWMSLRAADQIGGVSVVQLRALTVLDGAGESNLARLTEGMGVTMSTTSRLVDRLVGAGLVDRRPAAHTRRELALRLTPLGKRTLDRYDELRLVELRSCIDALPAGERAAAVAGLRAIENRAAGTVSQPTTA